MESFLFFFLRLLYLSTRLPSFLFLSIFKYNYIAYTTCRFVGKIKVLC